MVTVLVEFLFEPASCERVFALLKLMFGEQQIDGCPRGPDPRGNHAGVQRPQGRLRAYPRAALSVRVGARVVWGGLP